MEMGLPTIVEIATSTSIQVVLQCHYFSLTNPTITNRVGRKEWFYLCSPCGFTAHLGCTTATPRAPPPPPVQQTQAAHAQAAAGTQYFPTASPPQFPNYVPNVNYNGMPGGVRPMNYYNGMPGGVGQLGNAIMIMNQALQSLAGFGRFGGSSNQGLDNQAQLIQQILSGGGNDFSVGCSTDFGSSAGSIDPSSFGSTDFFSGAGGLGDFSGFGDFSSAGSIDPSSFGDFSDFSYF